MSRRSLKMQVEDGDGLRIATRRAFSAMSQRPNQRVPLSHGTSLPYLRLPYTVSFRNACLRPFDNLQSSNLKWRSYCTEHGEMHFEEHCLPMNVNTIQICLSLSINWILHKTRYNAGNPQPDPANFAEWDELVKEDDSLVRPRAPRACNLWPRINDTMDNSDLHSNLESPSSSTGTA